MRVSHVLGISMLLACQQASALDGKFSSTIGLDYSSGDYGASQDTEVWAVPMSLKYRTDTWNIRASTSYLKVTSPNFVTPDGDFIGTGNVLSTK